MIHFDSDNSMIMMILTRSSLDHFDSDNPMIILTRSRLILLQENNEKQEERLAKATLELAGACQRADGAVSAIKLFTNAQFFVGIRSRGPTGRCVQ